uniref:RAB6-interacting golgin n=1 Tax=Kalanchoe fedtschenkoi TaxID=63787 RepID=A0A7N0TRL5_KALFE
MEHEETTGTMTVNMKGNNGTGSSGRSTEDHEAEDDEVSELAMMSEFKAREEEIMRKKLEVKQRVESQLGRAEEEAKRLARIWEELEDLGDPTKKEVATVRKKIDTANRDLKPLAQSCQKKEKEFKEAVEAFNEKNKEKAQLVAALMELLAESERRRRRKLEELGSLVNSMR